MADSQCNAAVNAPIYSDELWMSITLLVKAAYRMTLILRDIVFLKKKRLLPYIIQQETTVWLCSKLVIKKKKIVSFVSWKG